MLKNIRSRAISKEFLISALFIALMFTAFGVNIENSYASDVNETADELGVGLDVEDKLENSQNDEVLQFTLNGGTFSDIKNAIRQANDGDTIDLNGEFSAQSSSDTISVSKRLTITSSSSATLNGKNLGVIMVFVSGSSGSNITNLKFVNGNSSNEGGAIRIFDKFLTIDSCIFESNYGKASSGAVHTSYDPRSAEGLVVKNCYFKNNSAGTAAGALGVFAYNFKIDNCVFESNHVCGINNSYGGAIQVGVDTDISYGVVSNCKFYNNKAISEKGISHGGAGCLRNNTHYENCLFVNNSADHGGAITFHASGSLNDCQFYNNKANKYGGALSISLIQDTMVLSLDNCLFEGNCAPLGGAAKLDGENIKIQNSQFNANTATEYGGAVNIDATDVSIISSSFSENIANINGGGVYISGKNTVINGSSFIKNEAVPNVNNLNDGLGGAVFVRSDRAAIRNNEFRLNTARNGSAVYYDSPGKDLNLSDNVMQENQAWVYALPVYACDIYYGDAENISSIIRGGNNIAKYDNLEVSNAVYNAADNENIEIDGETPVSGATMTGELYQDDREYNMDVLLTVTHEDGTVVYNKTLKSSYLGEVSDVLKNLKPGLYTVESTHFEDTYYKGITNTTSFRVIPKIDNRIQKGLKNDVEYNFDDIVVWTLNVTNYGPNNATEVTVGDVLPDGLIYIMDDSGEKYNSTTGKLIIGNLGVGESFTVNIVTVVNKTGEIANTANVTAREFDVDLTNNEDTASVYINPACDLEIIKEVDNPNPNYNDTITWSVTVTNNGPDIAHDIKVVDILPDSLIWIDDDWGNYELDSGLWEIDQLVIGESETLNIICRVNGTGVITNHVNVTSREFDYDLTNNEDNESIGVNSSADLSVEKSVNNSSPNYGEYITWTLIIRNDGPDKANGVYVEENLPEGLVLINYSATKGIFDNNVWAMCCLNRSETQTLKLICLVNKTGNLTNVAVISSDEYDPNPENNEDNETIEVPPSVDLELTKEVNNTNPDYGDIIMWTITLTNNGPDCASEVVVDDMMPEGLIILAWNATEGSYSDGKWEIGLLDVGCSEELNVTCIVNQLGEITNYAEARSLEYDWNKTNNHDSAFIEVTPLVDLAIEKYPDITNPDYGDLVKWTITVTNYGPNDASDVTVRDILPEGLTFVKSNSEDYSDGIINIGFLSAGNSILLEIITKVTATGDFTNYAEVTCYEKDTDMSNNHDDSSVFVAPASDLSITKVVSRYYHNLGDLIEYTIRIFNKGPDRADNIVADEIFDDSLRLISFKASAGDFNKLTGKWNIESLDVGQSASLIIRAVGIKEGISNNTVRVFSDNYDYDLTNNEDWAVVKISKIPEKIPKIPEKHKNKKYKDKIPVNALQKHVSGNSIFILLFSLVFLTGRFSKKP